MHDGKRSPNSRAAAHRARQFLRVLAALVALTCVGLAASSLVRHAALDRDAAAILTGYPVAQDGDDLRFGEVRVRLWGIAAPEDRRGLVQPGGPEARAALAALIDGRQVTCDLDGSTAGRSLRPVGLCRAGQVDLGEAMVRGGWARDCPAHSGEAYAQAEAAARAEGSDLSARYPLPGYCGEGE